ncbi:MAG: hypothetical protein WB819_03605 [Terriglobia bacterium]|jgi:hypothetical protein
MRILALVIAIYAPVMLLIHVSTARILKAWNEQPASRISRRFTPRRALRVEGVFWLLALAAWSLWQPLAWKVLVVLFAAIHLAIWAAGELQAATKNAPAFTTSPAMNRAIVAFDLLEAFLLAALGVLAVFFLLHPA